MITVLGLVFNILTVFVILKSSKLKSNFIAPLIFGLAVSDITFCLQLILVSVQFYQNEAFSEDSVWCYFSPILFREAKMKYLFTDCPATLITLCEGYYSAVGGPTAQVVVYSDRGRFDNFYEV